MKKIAVLFLMLATLLTACATETASPTPATEHTSGMSLEIPIAELSATAKFYPVTVDGVDMEAVAVKSADGRIRTVLNTCQVCNGSPNAYFVQKRDTLVCQNCGNAFPISRIGAEAGGCNPVPISDADKTIANDTITVSYAFLQSKVALFKTWKPKS